MNCDVTDPKQQNQVNMDWELLTKANLFSLQVDSLEYFVTVMEA